MQPGLSDAQRKAIHELALWARELLLQEAREVLEGAYGIYRDGRRDAPDKLPALRDDAEAQVIYADLVQHLNDAERAGLSRRETVAELTKEIAFTHLNRLAAFKMLEARDLTRGILARYHNANGFLFYLAEHSDDYAHYQQGRRDAAYRHFLLWQCGQIAQELNVLFDPQALAGRIFPRPRALAELVERLNDGALAPIWQADETVGWIYQFFNEPDKDAAFARLKNRKKLRPEDVPDATQLFTTNWIVRYLVHNTLGRLWLQMHPDTRLQGSELLDYLAPLEGEAPSEALRPVRELRLLDPACGAMHFGVVAFDLFAAMYAEELDRAGEPGWPETPSVADAAQIPAAILAHNLHGIDIDLRAVQLSALALYLKAKSLNPHAQIDASNLVCADVRPLNGQRLGVFLREMNLSPTPERLTRALWTRLQEVHENGSLFRLERDLAVMIREERARQLQPRLFADEPQEFEAEALQEAWWAAIEDRIIKGLNMFAEAQAEQGVDQRFFTAEAVKGLRLLDVLLGDYDAVVTNPPYSSSGNLESSMSDFLKAQYPEGKGDLYAAFIQRCTEFLREGGRLGMITQQSFMFLSSYEKLRVWLRERVGIETMAHTGTGAFVEIGGEVVNTTAFVLRQDADTVRREDTTGTYYRLVHAGNGDAKRVALEQALADGNNRYCVQQRRFDAIPGSPWVYWIGDSIRGLFERLPSLGDVASARQGLATADNFRFLRYWWEVGPDRIAFGCRDGEEAKGAGRRWFPYMKGGGYCQWYGSRENVVNWYNDGVEIRNFYTASGRLASRPQNTDYYFLEGVTLSLRGTDGLSGRLMPSGCIFDVAGSSVFAPHSSDMQIYLGVLNSRIARYVFDLLNPTFNTQIGDLIRLPMPIGRSDQLRTAVRRTVWMAEYSSLANDAAFEFIVPSVLAARHFPDSSRCAEYADLEASVAALYGLGSDDWREIVEEDESQRLGQETVDGRDVAPDGVSFAVGIILGRFHPGDPGSLGSAVYRRDDFAVGSLPAPEEAEFDELVGAADTFAYVDCEGGRHV
ncbi:MAG: BREX-1 system adenine-specific DNA-methyltransferase PglX, partial [Anaerolineales bacterium]|nr:BREX-1 system adenine-specific DNA-methyltransferase PglX [Anaerolineales bacterium]